MNPLSPFTYYCRHKGQALLLLVLIGSLTLGVFVMTSVMSAAMEGFLCEFYYLTRASRVMAGQTLEPSTVAQLRTHPDVAAVIPENGLSVNFSSWFLLESRPVLGVLEGDLEMAMETYDLRLKEGRLIEPRAAEVILSEEVVNALDLDVGDAIGHEIDDFYFPTIATELTLVGILESVPSQAGPDIQAGFVSYEYLESHEAYQPRLPNLLIIPRPGRRVAVNDLAETLIEGSTDSWPAHLVTFEREMAFFSTVIDGMRVMFIFAAGIVAVAAALVVSMVNRIAIARRLPELGLLHAAGYDRRSLTRRLGLEIVTITGIGWASGFLLSIAASILLNGALATAGRPIINLANPAPFLLTLPIPFAIVGWVTISVRRVLNRLDAVAIVERGKLSMEDARGRKQGKVRSPRNPLSSWTFYLRHRLRSLALLASTSLMVLGVAFPAFVFTMMTDVIVPVWSYVSHASIVMPAPTYQAVNPAVLAQIRSHPAVAHVIPVRGLSMADNIIPYTLQVTVYGVRDQDLQMLLDAYDLHLAEGHLPEPRSSQIVLTRALARNRDLKIGDIVARSIDKRDSIPTELTVVGLLDSTAPRLVQREGAHIPIAPRHMAFVSYEFVEHHERYTSVPMHALIVPVEGHEAEVEAWLEESIASPQVTVGTLSTVYRDANEGRREMMRLLAVTESILAMVATGALAILNTIFVSQRRDEFGVLHAAGHNRAVLIRRTVKESVGIAGVAWLIGAACCAILVLGAQAFVYVPRGLSLDLPNLAPWLFTLPIPVAVVAASAGTIAWTLSRLDPVAIIERR